MFSQAKIAVFILLLGVTVFAQNEDEAAKERQRKNLELLQQIVNDARGLKLPENRALVAAKAGSIICKADAKAAAKLFDEAASGLIAAASEGEAQVRNPQNYLSLRYGQEPRWTILNMMSECDALLALDIMSRTRPPRLVKAISELAAESIFLGRRSKGSYYGSGQYAVNELQYEQTLITKAAEQDPSRVVALVRESIKKGITYQTMSLLQKVQQKDAEAANRLTDEAMHKLMDADFSDNGQYIDTLGQYLNEVTRDPGQNNRALRVPEGTIREAMDKMLNFWLDPDTTYFYGQGSAFAAIEKYQPERAARVKRKFEQRETQTQTPQQKEYSRLMSGEASVEEMVSKAPKLQPYMRVEVFQRAAQKLVESGNISEAEKLLEDNLTDEQAENSISQLMTSQGYTTIGNGKYQEGEAIVERIVNPHQKIQLLIYLANCVYNKDPKANDKWAASLMARARSLLPDQPETYEDITSFFNLATSAAAIDPDGSFRMAESMLPTLNELSQANATMAKLRSNGTYRNGEFQITNGQNAIGVYGLENVLRTLKDKDFDRVVRITNGIERLDARLAYQLQLIDGNSGMMIVDLPVNTRSFTNFVTRDGR